MKCPVCLTHYYDPQEGNNIIFSGACSECLSNMDCYYKRSWEDKQISEEEALNEGLTIFDLKEEV